MKPMRDSSERCERAGQNARMWMCMAVKVGMEQFPSPFPQLQIALSATCPKKMFNVLNKWKHLVQGRNVETLWEAMEKPGDSSVHKYSDLDSAPVVLRMCFPCETVLWVGSLMLEWVQSAWDVYLAREEKDICDSHRGLDWSVAMGLRLLSKNQEELQAKLHPPMRMAVSQLPQWLPA